MTLAKKTVYALDQRTPSDLVAALAAAFEASNGVGQSFEVSSLSYSLPDGVTFHSQESELSEIGKLEAFPSDFLLSLSSFGDSNVGAVWIERDTDRIRLRVSARTPTGLTDFLGAFAAAFQTRETVSTFDEGLRDLEARIGKISSTYTPPAQSPALPSQRRPGRARVLLFTALQEERDMFEKAFGLKTAFENNVASGVRHGIELELISARRMGRVPAAVAISSHLATSDSRFEMIVVAGLAGGFVEAGMQTGAVVVATDIVDLATRKKLDAETEFRPHQYTMDDALERFAKSSSFDASAWERDLVNRDGWPQGRRPYIVYGQLASVDEVVSSDVWRGELRDAWPKLVGVEMEAGGACAAAERFGHRTVVVRGVSDLADPRKSDDRWRQLAMSAVVALVDSLLSAGVVRPV